MQMIRLAIRLRAEQEAFLPPYTGSMLRGVLGMNLRRYCCDRPHGACKPCDRLEACPYAHIFHDIADASGEHDILNPYIIRPEWGQQHLRPGDVFRFRLTLFNQATTHVDLFLRALADLDLIGLGAQRRRFSLCEVMQEEGHRLLFYEGRWLTSAEPVEIGLPEERMAQGVRLRFLTPLRYKVDGIYSDGIHLASIVKSAMRRYAMLEGLEMREPNEAFLREARCANAGEKTCWVALERYSNRANTSMEFGGIMGEAMFEGRLTRYIPWLEIGRILHVGKNCTFGYGGYDLGVWA